MKKTLITLAILSAVFFGFQTETRAKAAWNFITLSSYYALPTQGVSVSGDGFFPNEPVRVSLVGANQQVITDSGGRFTSDPFTIPYGVINSTITARAVGGRSGYVSAAKLKVGTYYPVVEPSSYYLQRGSSVTFTGRDFAPNEIVTVKNGAATVGKIQANDSGSILAESILIPNTAGARTYLFTGALSKKTYSVKVRLY
ncbi:MAG: hypothetical protein ACM3KM_03585 [Acidobacteriaceae bacterium]